ncbi:MAG: hypothetical protein NVSMB46_03290 [Candidatus Saccharimonadales bacterium]
MPSIDGGDQLSPEYAPWAYIGPNKEYFVWQTSQKAEHDGYLYRIGMVDDNEVVCERRPITDAKLVPHAKTDNIEMVPVELIPEGLFPSLQTMSVRLAEVKTLVDQIDPSRANSDQLDTTVRSKLK